MRKQPDGEIMQIIYLKMLLACIGNSGLILYQGVYDSLAEEIAEEIDEETGIVQKTIDYILRNNMAREIEDKEGGGYFFPESDEFTGSESESAERMRRMREKAKTSQCDRNVTERDNSVTDSDDNKVKNNKVREEKETENTLFTSLTLKEGDTPSPSADAGEAPTFTLSECKECAAKGKVNLTEDGIQAFYERMEKDGWKIKGTRVENLLKAMRGFAKNHKRYQKQEAESQKAKEEVTSQKEQRSEREKGKDSIERSIYKIAKKYISKRLFDENVGGHHCLIRDYCPKESFSETQLDYMADNWSIWPVPEIRVKKDEYLNEEI